MTTAHEYAARLSGTPRKLPFKRKFMHWPDNDRHFFLVDLTHQLRTDGLLSSQQWVRWCMILLGDYTPDLGCINRWIDAGAAHRTRSGRG